MATTELTIHRETTLRIDFPVSGIEADVQLKAESGQYLKPSTVGD